MFSFFIYSTIVIVAGFVGIAWEKKNMLFLLLYLEIVYMGHMFAFIYIGEYHNDASAGIFFLIVIVTTAAEMVVGLTLSVLYFRTGYAINIDNLCTLYG